MGSTVSTACARPVIGLTGGIGSGKSAAADLFAGFGADVVDTDLIAHQLTAPGGDAMAAIAAAWALEVPWATVRSGLASFVNDARTAPGRFNVFSYRGATLVADYGHNPDAIRALVEAIDNMPTATGSRRSVVISGAGDRRGDDVAVDHATLAFFLNGDLHGTSRCRGNVDQLRLGSETVPERRHDEQQDSKPDDASSPLDVHCHSFVFSTSIRSSSSSRRRTSRLDTAAASNTTSAAKA